MKALGQSFGDILADATLAVQDRRDMALRHTVGKVALFQAMLLHEKA